MNSIAATNRGMFRAQRGATMVEYAMGMALIVVILIGVAYGFLLAGTTRVNESIGTTQNIAPCSDRLANLTTTYNGDSVSTDSGAQGALCD